MESGAVLEAPAVVAGLDDVAVVSETIEQRSGHFGIAEDARPFAEGEICRDDDRRTLVEAADGVEQQLSAELGEGQIKFVEDGRPPRRWRLTVRAWRRSLTRPVYSVVLSTGVGDLPLIDLERRGLEARDQLAAELDRVADWIEAAYQERRDAETVIGK